ncbi:MAG: acetyl-CoA carboxylase biotin carboxylase subunit [bacterium JZ-2024 1]
MQRLLIANRGEIACRIIRSCRELGIEVAVVYSDADQNSLPVWMADKAIPLGGNSLQTTYLDMHRIVEIAREVKADAIHPGYGFLAENADFARLCEKNGIIFVGPSPDVIRFLGDKMRARNLAQRLRVKTVPGSTGILKNVDEAKRIAAQVKYPVLLKAVAGGGGRGMRLVHSPDEMEKMFSSASSEALAAFGNGFLYLEKYLHHPRHIEVQILGDHYGHILHLFERECSLQRKHQKILEETPSPSLTEKIRLKLVNAALSIARAVGYTSAGTFEFLFDQKSQKFYFIEANTRIQVEHPITEAVTGIDLIAWQIRIAQGEPLTLTQKEIQTNGHSIECRINAEDASRGFASSTGKVHQVIFPSGLGIRVDSHLYTGYDVPGLYDSLLAKIIVHGKNREEAINRMVRALKETHIMGIPTLIPFHLFLLLHPQFRAGNYSIHFLEEILSQYPASEEEEETAGALISALLEWERKLHGTVIQPRETPGAGIWAILGRDDLTRGK